MDKYCIIAECKKWEFIVHKGKQEDIMTKYEELKADESVKHIRLLKLDESKGVYIKQSKFDR